MATTSTSRSTPSLHVSPITADTIQAELHEHADRVESEAAQNGQPRIHAARIRNIRRVAKQYERIAATTTEDDE